MLIDSDKLIAVLKDDIKQGNNKIASLNVFERPKDAMIYHICKDEIAYIESLIETIEQGVYDAETDLP